MAEIVWAKVKGFPGYQISNEGVIVDDKGNKVRVYDGSHGYESERAVSLKKGRKYYKKSVSSLMRENFSMDDQAFYEMDTSLFSRDADEDTFKPRQEFADPDYGGVAWMFDDTWNDSYFYEGGNCDDGW